MNYNTQNAKIASITEKTLIIGIDVGSETHYARAFSWRNYEYSKKPFAFSNDEAGFAAFKEWMDDIAEKLEMEVIIPGMEPTGHYWLNLGAYLQEQNRSALSRKKATFTHSRLNIACQMPVASRCLTVCSRRIRNFRTVRTSATCVGLSDSLTK